MILWEGRKAMWKDREVIIVEKITKDRVKVVYSGNHRMQRIVKREDLSPIWRW